MLSPTLGDRNRLRQLSLKSFIGWSVTGAVFYDVIIPHTAVGLSVICSSPISLG